MLTVYWCVYMVSGAGADAVAALCRSAAGVVAGGVDPLELLFPAAGSMSAADLYRDSVGGRALNALVAEAAARAAEALPAGRGLRILEVGAGYLCNHGVRPGEGYRRGGTGYVFTDIGPGFLAAARARFREFDNVRYRVLDVERDPTTQGFERDRFDLVIAANVLHATRDLRESLASIRRLDDRGILIVLEGTRPVRWARSDIRV